MALQPEVPAQIVSLSQVPDVLVIVNSLADDPDVNTGDGLCATAGAECTLRAAIEESNALAGTESITFAPSLNGATITLGGSSLSITDDVRITGPGADLLGVSGNDQSRVLDIGSGITVEIEALRITAGQTPSLGSNVDQSGAGIFNRGTLSLSQSQLSDNSATDDGGAIFNDRGGDLTLRESVISGNSATGTGGGVFNYEGTVRIETSTLRDNSADFLSGAVDNFGGTIMINNSTLSGNVAAGSVTSNGDGGAIGNRLGTTTLTDSTIEDNTATGDGGGIFVFSGTVRVTNTLIEDNSAAIDGGGLFNSGGATAVVSRSTISNNQATQGGGIFNLGNLTVEQSQITGNQAVQGGGIFTPYTWEILPIGVPVPICTSPTTTIINSTIEGNIVGDVTRVIKPGYRLLCGPIPNPQDQDTVELLPSSPAPMNVMLLNEQGSQAARR